MLFYDKKVAGKWHSFVINLTFVDMDVGQYPRADKITKQPIPFLYQKYFAFSNARF
jgi:hypothetical protein